MLKLNCEKIPFFEVWTIVDKNSIVEKQWTWNCNEKVYWYYTHFLFDTIKKIIWYQNCLRWVFVHGPIVLLFYLHARRSQRKKICLTRIFIQTKNGFLINFGTSENETLLSFKHFKTYNNFIYPDCCFKPATVKKVSVCY